MLNGEAFISEAIAQGGGEGPGNEYVEITISKTADLSDYTLSFYHSSSGLLEPGYSGGGASPGSSFFPGQGEFTLADVANQTGTLANPEGSVASGINGRALQIVEHPDDSSFWVVIVPFSGAARDSNSNSVGTVALTNTAISESQAYNIGGGSTSALQNGAAAGTNQVQTGSGNAQIDGFGNITAGTITPGDSVLCFETNVQIDVPGGTRAAGDLKSGDKVVCEDGEFRPVVWIGKSHAGKTELACSPKLRPVRIVAGALGDGCPSHDLLVSRQHRIVVRSKIAQRMFGEAEVLVAAIKLTKLPGIFVDDTVDEVTYVHVLLERHEILVANGALAESLFSGPEARKIVGPNVWDKLKATNFAICFADLEAKPARFIPQGNQQKRLIERHRKAKKPVFQKRCTRLCGTYSGGDSSRESSVIAGGALSVF